MRVILIAFAGLLVGCTTLGTNAATNSSKENEKVLRHIVLFQWNDQTSEEKISEITSSFAELPSKIPQIIDFEYGLNNSPEGLDKGFTHCFMVTFATEKDREIYLPHPDHQAFVKLIGDHVKDVLVVDYWTE